MKPIHKRWPDRFAMRLTLYHKDCGGKAVEYETDLSDDDRRELDALILKLINRKRPDESEGRDG